MAITNSPSAHALLIMALALLPLRVGIYVPFP